MLMRALIRTLFLAAVAIVPCGAYAANQSVPNMSTVSSVLGTDIFYDSQGGGNNKATAAQIASYFFGTVSGDCTATGLGVITCLKTNGVSFGTAATVNTGTSGATIGLLNGNLTFSGSDTFSGALTFSGLGSGTQTQCLGLTSGNAVVPSTGACGSGGGGSPGGTNGQIQYNNSGAFGGLTPAIATGCGATGGTIGNSLSGTIASAESTNAQTGAGYTVQSTDCGKLITLSNASAQTLTLNNLSANQYFDVLNIGAGTWTLSAGTGSIVGGPTSLTQNQGARIVYDGTNWHVQAGAGSGSSPTQTITAGTNITTSGTCSGTALSCTVNASGGGTSNGAVSIPQSNYWMSPQPYYQSSAGSGLTASSQFCTVGFVSQSVTIKQLGGTVTTGQTGAAVAFGLYSVANAAGVTTWTPIDHTGSITATGAADATGTLVVNTTDTLSPGTLYGFCMQTNSVANVVMWALSGVWLAPTTLIGSKTLDNANRFNNNLVGWQKTGITFGTWTTQTLNSGSGDMTELQGAPMILFEVN